MQSTSTDSSRVLPETAQQPAASSLSRRRFVQAGAAAVERVGGKLILAHVIARPHDELAALLPK